MAKILVAGGLGAPEEDPKQSGARKQFAACIGREIVSRGHILIGGCRTELDAVVAQGGRTAALEQKLEVARFIRSWVTQSTIPSHNIGEIQRSQVVDWGRVPRGFIFPEPIQVSDVVIVIGGWDGTHYAASWARLANKPLVPVAAFGLAASEIFRDELNNFERKYPTRLSQDDFGILNRLLINSEPETIDNFAKEVVSLAERMITPTEVFVIMSFAEKGHLKDAYNTFKRVCEANGFRAFKVDQHFDARQRIVPSIISSIRRSAFIIADLTEPRPNVYYELGYAQALGKDILTTAQEGTSLPFDVFDIPTHFWDSQDSLEQKLQRDIEAIAERFGRRHRVA
jgi:hypothetical protein